jgi:hypothetical protein
MILDFLPASPLMKTEGTEPGEGRLYRAGIGKAGRFIKIFMEDYGYSNANDAFINSFSPEGTGPFVCRAS